MTLLLILWVVCAGVAAVIAKAKDRSVGGFAMAGLLLGVLGVIWAACAASAEDVAMLRRRRENLRRLRAKRGNTPARSLDGMRPLSWHD